VGGKGEGGDQWRPNQKAAIMSFLPSQLPLELPFEQHMTAAHFFVSEANAPAHALVTYWPKWPSRVVLLTGPEGAGKTHLTSVWCAQSGAVRLSGADIAGLHIGEEQAYAVENIDGERVCEQKLFHILNSAREANAWLLLTSRLPAHAQWPALPDLASRLRALPHAALAGSDDGLVRAVLIKQFKDRQLIVEPDVIDYVVRRMERSLGMVRILVEALDREALALGRRVTRAVAAQVLMRVSDEGEDDG
jgi:chromosomal replication initiation ATPase DnaA